jgi:putative phosphonate metabolism protein
MDEMKRYAVYYAPRLGPLAERAAGWLGRDVASGRVRPRPDVPGLPLPAEELTRDPARYGFHGTLRAPFRLADGHSAGDLAATVAGLAAGRPPVVCEGLRLEVLQGFVALLPLGCEAALLDLAAAVVEGTDPFRAPPTEAEILRRRPDTLSPRQRELLRLWGYPYVMDELRFHLTLTGQLPEDRAAAVEAALAAHFGPVLPRPFVIEDLCLFGEDAEGRFHLLDRYALSG